MSDFADRPLYTTPVVGLRAFIPVGGELLAPVTRSYAWGPGENVAQCNAGPLFRLLSHPISEPHEPGSMAHGCGFYAYYDGSNDHLERYGDRVAGIIAGYGTVTAGHRGFRAGKARILALIRPAHADYLPSQAILQGEIAKNYPGIPWYTTEAEALEAHPLTNPADLGIHPPKEPESRTASRWRTYAGPMPVARHIHYANASQIAAAFNQSIEGVAKVMNNCAESMEKLKQLADLAEPDPLPTDPLERKKAIDQQRAQQRAGLRGTGGIDRRRGQLR